MYDMGIDFNHLHGDAKALSTVTLKPEELKELKELFTTLGTDLNFAMYISFIHLLFPINQFGEWYLIR